MTSGTTRARRGAGALAGTRRGSPSIQRVNIATTARLVATPPGRRVKQTLRRLFGPWLFAKLVAVAVLAGGFASAAHVASSDQFHVTEVVVAGTDLVAAEDIAATIDVAGANTFVIRGRRMARLLQADPAIASASVQARLPDGVDVVVHERVPAVLWEADGRTLLADETGLALRDGVRPDLPLIHAPDGPAPGPGGRVNPEIVRLAMSLTPRLEVEGLAGGQIEYRPATGASVILPDATRIALGAADDLEDKLTAYRAIRAHLDQTSTRAQFVDVRFLERPYFR